MPFTLPSRDQLSDEFLARFGLAFPEKNIARGSEPYRLARVVSGFGWSLIAYLASYALKQLLPDTADEEWLRRWSTLYGEPFLSASPSSGALALQVSGAPGSAVPAGAELAHADGTLFQVTSIGAVVGGGGTVNVSIVSTTKGLAANKTAGQTLSFTNPPGGLAGDALLVGDLTGGLEAETADEFRVRLQEILSTPPEGGAVHDYPTWVKRVRKGITVYVYRFRRGWGTMDIVVLGPGSGAERILGDLSPFAAMIDANRPATVKDVAFLTVVPNLVNVRVRVEIDSDRFQWDWDDAGTGHVVTAVNPGLKQITVPGLPGTAIVGKRLQVLGYEAKITARAGSVLTLDVWPGANPIGSMVRASGDLVVPIQHSIRALIDSLGPPRGDYAVSQWKDGLRLNRLGAAIEDTDGVLDYVIDVPASSYVALDAPGLTTSLYVTGVVDVYRLS